MQGSCVPSRPGWREPGARRAITDQDIQDNSIPSALIKVWQDMPER
jgi:hypothetical protein